MILLAVFLFLCAGCTIDVTKQYIKKSGRLFLTDWEYSLDGKNFSPLEINNLEKLYRLTPERKGYVTLRTTVSLPKDFPHEEAAINFGNVYIAAKFFIDGKQVDSVGYFPPNAFTSGKQTHCVKIPDNVLASNRPFTVSAVFWVEGRGGMSGVPFIASYSDVSLTTQYQSFLLSKIYFAFAVFGGSR